MLSLPFMTLALAVFTAANAQTTSNLSVADVRQAFSAANIVPNTLPSFNPSAILDVVYTDPASNNSLVVTPGVNMTIEQVVNQPRFLLTSNDTALENATFVLVMIDPDAPTPQDPIYSPIRHLLAGDNHPQGNLNAGAPLVNSSAALDPYLSPGPTTPAPHRYIQLLYAQPSGFDTNALKYINTSSSLIARLVWNLTAFSEEVGMGSPIAGNFFYCANSTDQTTSTNSTSSITSGGLSSSDAAVNTGKSLVAFVSGSLFYLAISLI